LWFAGSFGYGWGGATAISAFSQGPLENIRASALARLPLGRAHGLKLVYVNALTTKRGVDFDTFQVVYQYVFGGKP
jgi:hypothetical protein